jgi:hypothetical protein
LALALVKSLASALVKPSALGKSLVLVKPSASALTKLLALELVKPLT